MKKFDFCGSCEFETVPNEDGTCYNCGELVGTALVEVENSDAYNEVSYKKVAEYLEALAIGPDGWHVEQLGLNKYVRVAAFAEGRKRYIQRKLNYCSQYGSN